MSTGNTGARRADDRALARAGLCTVEIARDSAPTVATVISFNVTLLSDLSFRSQTGATDPQHIFPQLREPPRPKRPS
jgi:hypothetical protein